MENKFDAAGEELHEGLSKSQAINYLMELAKSKKKSEYQNSPTGRNHSQLKFNRIDISLVCIKSIF